MAPTPSLTGMWVKDKANSDSMDPVCDLLKDEKDEFEVTLKAGGILDVRERYPWSGESVLHGRRDKRKGKHSAYVARTETGPTVHVKWDDPYGGTCWDNFRLGADGNTLEQHSEITVGGKSVAYVSRFRRQH